MPAPQCASCAWPLAPSPVYGCCPGSCEGSHVATRGGAGEGGREGAIERKRGREGEREERLTWGDASWLRHLMPVPVESRQCESCAITRCHVNGRRVHHCQVRPSQAGPAGGNGHSGRIRGLGAHPVGVDRGALSPTLRRLAGPFMYTGVPLEEGSAAPLGSKDKPPISRVMVVEYYIPIYTETRSFKITTAAVDGRTARGRGARCRAGTGYSLNLVLARAGLFPVFVLDTW